MLNREIENMVFQYNQIKDKLNQISIVMADLQNRDDNIYRVIFEAEPIPNSIRKAGYGGVNRYEALKGYNNSDLIINTTKKLDQISKQLYIQSKSFDEIIELAKHKSEMLVTIPAIQPVSNKNLSRMASGFGPRIDPIYKQKNFMLEWIFLQKLAPQFTLQEMER